MLYSLQELLFLNTEVGKEKLMRIVPRLSSARIYRLAPWRYFTPLYPVLVLVGVLWIILLSTANTDISTVLFVGLLLTSFCLLVGALMCLTTMNVHLEMAPDGIMYYGTGYQVYSPWSNILEVDEVHYGFRKVDGVRLRLPAGEEVPMDFGIREHIPAFEASRWWRGNRAMRPLGKVLAVGERRHVTFEDMSAYHGFIPVGYFAPYGDASELWTTLHQYMREASRKKK